MAFPEDSEQNRQRIMTWEIEAGHIKRHNQPSGWYKVSSVGGPVRRRACLIGVVRKGEKRRKPDGEMAKKSERVILSIHVHV